MPHNQSVPSEKFLQIKALLLEMEMKIIQEDTSEELFVVDDEENGIKNLIIDLEPPLLVIEQLIMPIKGEKPELYKRLLQMNETLVHGAFAIDAKERFVLFRDTLQIENLDSNELQGSIRALSLAMAEHSSELLNYAHQS